MTIETPHGTLRPGDAGAARRASGANAVVAVRLLEAARGARHRASLATRSSRVSPTREWPARLELLRLDERPSGAARRRAQPRRRARRSPAYLRRWHPERPPLVIGVMRDKDVAGDRRPLLPQCPSRDRDGGADAARHSGRRSRAPSASRRRRPTSPPSRTPTRAIDRALEQAPTRAASPGRSSSPAPCATASSGVLSSDNSVPCAISSLVLLVVCCVCLSGGADRASRSSLINRRPQSPAGRRLPAARSDSISDH